MHSSGRPQLPFQAEHTPWDLQVVCASFAQSSPSPSQPARPAVAEMRDSPPSALSSQLDGAWWRRSLSSQLCPLCSVPTWGPLRGVCICLFLFPIA